MAYKPPKQTIVDNDLKGVPSNEAVFEGLKLKLPKPSVDGTNGQLLARGASADDTSWVNPPAAGFTNPMTNAGDIIVGGVAGAAGRLALGTVDKVLVSDGTTVSYQYAGLGGGSLGTNNIVLGRAKPTSLSGTANTIVGAGTTANSLSSGTGNTYLGYRSGEVLSTGNYNITIGAEAGKNITTGSNNLMVGYLAGDGVSTNSNNTLVGNGAGGGVNTFNHSEATMLGSQVNYFGQACNNSVFIGYRAAIGARSANNVIIGSNAAAALTTGSDTISIGRDSARVLTTGGSNTVLGSGAAYTNLTTGARNTLLGSETDTLATSTSDSISLGHRAKAASNEFAVGSSTSQINTIYLGRGGETQTVANAIKIMSMKGTGTNTDLSAGTVTLAGSQSTGSAAGSSVFVATAAAGAAGTTLNSHTNRLEVTAAGDVKVLTGQLSIETVGKGLSIKTGTNAKMGRASLVGVNSITVNTTAVTTNSYIFLTGVNGDAFYVQNIVNGVSFDIVHSTGSITADCNWLIIEPA